MTETNELIFITGATGFLGSWIIARLVEKGIRVIATDLNEDHRRLSLLKPELPTDLIDFRVCDITDGEKLEALISETRPTAIIHLAALQIPHCRLAPAAGAAVNIGGQINVFEAARKNGIRRVLYTSSIAAKPRQPANAPSNLYGVFKKTGEEIARIYWQDYKLPSLGLRPYIVYGVGRDDGETSAITRAIEAAATGQSYEIPFTTRSCFEYAGDIAEVFARAALASWDGAILSDITKTVHSTSEIVSAIRSVVPEATISCLPRERISPDAGFETDALHNVIGDWNEVPLETGIRKTVDLFREIAARG